MDPKDFAEELEARLEGIEYALVILLADQPEAKTGQIVEIVRDLGTSLRENEAAYRDDATVGGLAWPITHRSLPYLENYAGRAVWTAKVLQLNAKPEGTP